MDTFFKRNSKHVTVSVVDSISLTQKASPKNHNYALLEPFLGYSLQQKKD